MPWTGIEMPSTNALDSTLQTHLGQRHLVQLSGLFTYAVFFDTVGTGDDSVPIYLILLLTS